jgi:hypothetical protein
VLLVALLAIGVSTDLVIESSEGVAAPVAAALAADLGAAIERRTGIPCRLGESGAADRVSLSLFGAITKIRVIAARRGVATIEVDLPLERDGWGADLDDLARALYLRLDVLQGPRELPLASGKSIEAEPPIVSWIVVGAGVAVVATGVGLMIAGLGVRGSLGDPGLDTTEVEARHDRQQLLFGISAGVIALGAGVMFAGLLAE